MKNMKIKKFLSMTLAVVMVCSMLALPTFASSNEASVANYAYMQTKGASEELTEKILLARYDIIYGSDQGWSVDGSVYVEHEDGTIEYLPKFSDLYPGWNLSEISKVVKHENAAVTTFLQSRAAASVIWEGSVKLKVTTSGAIFHTFTSAGGQVEISADTLPGNKYNVAVVNQDTSAEIAYKPNMIISNTLKFNTTYLVRYACRASSPDTAGDAYLIIEYTGN
jgi:hypothetical protein